MHQYPPRVQRIVLVLCVFLLGLNLAEYALEWARALYAALYPHLHPPFIPFLEPSQNILHQLLVAHLGLFVTLLFVRALAYSMPGISLHTHGLMMHSPLGQRFIPFNALRGLRSTELADGGRFVIWVQSRPGLPLQNWLGSLLFGRWDWSGFVLTSDIEGFEEIVAAIVGALKSRYGEQFPAHFQEQPPTWLLGTLNTPRTVIHAAIAAEEAPLSEIDALLQMLSVALALALPAAISGFIHLQFPWAMLLAPILAMVEWPLVGFYLSIVPIGDTHHMEFRDALRIYPPTQLPRWVAAVGLTLLVAAGAPAPLLLLAGVLAAGLGGYLALQLVEEWFEVKPPDAYVGILATVVYQLFVYEVLLAFLPR